MTGGRIGFRQGGGQVPGFGFSDDADFLRKLKPSLVLARTRGRTSGPLRRPDERRRRPQQPARSIPRPKVPAAPNPLVIVGVAFVAGIVLAKLLDPRGHG